MAAPDSIPRSEASRPGGRGLSLEVPKRRRRWWRTLRSALGRVRLGLRHRTARPRRLIAVHQRLGGVTGHRFPEALGLMREAPPRGFQPVLFINRDADAAVRAALPTARAVLHDPVFRADLSFDDRTRDFVAMLHEHVDAEVGGGDLVLMTVATQCEARALVEWVDDLCDESRPTVVFFFHSDRWNRYGDVERARQAAEFEVVRHSLSGLRRRVAARLLFGASTPQLAREISGLLGVEVSTAPLPMVYANAVGSLRASNARSSTPRVGLMGGARPEKGFHRARAILEASRLRTRVHYLIQLANEQMSPEAWADLENLAAEPDIDVLRGGLSIDAYADALASCDILLFPYDRLPYRWRVSGIFADAVAAGRPVVVPSDTWIADAVVGGAAAGLIYEGDEAERIADAVAQAVDRLPSLSAQARVLAAPWRCRYSLSAFLDWAEDGSRRAALRARRG